MTDADRDKDKPQRSHLLPAPPPHQSTDVEVPDDPAAELASGLQSSLLFDGYKLHWLGAQSVSWTAFSGAATENIRESVKDIGPTPQGTYAIYPSEIQDLEWSTPWGAHRVILHPSKTTIKRMTDCFNLLRTQMYVHGGTDKGTIGCIELNDKRAENELFSKLAAYNHNHIWLEVKYIGGRKAAYEEPTCPYPINFTS